MHEQTTADGAFVHMHTRASMHDSARLHDHGHGFFLHTYLMVSDGCKYDQGEAIGPSANQDLRCLRLGCPCW